MSKSPFGESADGMKEVMKGFTPDLILHPTYVTWIDSDEEERFAKKNH